MKKLYKVFTFILVSVFTTVLLTSCSFSPAKLMGEVRAVKISIYDGENCYSCKIMYDKISKFNVNDINGKSGYYLEGIYDAEEGGTKYFDSTGQTLFYWSATFPTVFYTRWDSIYNLEQEFNIVGESYNVVSAAGNPSFYYWESFNEQFICAFKENSDRNLKVEYSVDLETAGGTGSIFFYLDNKYISTTKGKYLLFSNSCKKSEGFKNFNGSIIINSSEFVDRQLNLKVYVDAFLLSGNKAYFKNFTLKISFAE